MTLPVALTHPHPVPSQPWKKRGKPCRSLSPSGYINLRIFAAMGDAVTSKIFAMAVLAGAVFLTVKFYWLRILACGGILNAWGAVAVVCPLYVAADDLREERFLLAISTIAISCLIVVP